jgi:hypothetical protein
MSIQERWDATFQKLDRSAPAQRADEAQVDYLGGGGPSKVVLIVNVVTHRRRMGAIIWPKVAGEKRLPDPGGQHRTSRDR